ncbi:MAG: PQQ-binding-like beta-propeller repeat protein [Myxococcota bacterium]
MTNESARPTGARSSPARIRLVVGLSLGVLAVVGGYFLLRDRWDERGIAEVIALEGGHAVLVESTYSRSESARELTLTRVDAAGEEVWRTTVMTGGGNIGDVVSLDANPSVLVLRLDPDDHSNALVGISARDGRQLWSAAMTAPSYAAISTLTDGDAVWLSDYPTLEKRDAATGRLQWTSFIEHPSLVVADGAAVMAGHYVAKDGVKRELVERAASPVFGNSCVVGDQVVVMPTFMRDLRPADPDGARVSRIAPDGAVSGFSLPLTARWRESEWLDLSGMVCGHVGDLDVITLERRGDDVSNYDVVGLDAATHQLRWTIPLGRDRAVSSVVDMVRARDVGALPRYLAVVVQVDNGVRWTFDVKPGESDTDAGVRASGEFHDKGGDRHDYRLDLLDLTLGRVLWSYPLATGAKPWPVLFRTDCCQVAFVAESSQLLVVSTQRGELVKAVTYDGARYLRPRQLADDVLWLIDGDSRHAHGYRLPDLVSADTNAPAMVDATAPTLARVVRKQSE